MKARNGMKQNYSTNALPDIRDFQPNKLTKSEKKLRTSIVLPNALITECNNSTDREFNYLRTEINNHKKSKSPERKIHYNYTPAFKKNPLLKALYKDNDELAEKIKKIKNTDVNKINLEKYHNEIINELFGSVSNENLSKLLSSLKEVRVYNKMDIKTAKKIEQIEESKKLIFPGLSVNMLNINNFTSRYK